jgi:hypothetical protein
VRAPLLTLLAALAVAASAGTADATERPEDEAAAFQLDAIRVEGGEAEWHGDNQFGVTVDRAHPGQSPPEGTVLSYRLLGPGGEPYGSTVSIEPVRESFSVEIPTGPGGAAPPPGAYSLSVWLHSDKRQGNTETATLRFDNARPGPARPVVPAGWLGAGSSVKLEIEHPGGPPPPSGIRGYAIELDRGSGAEPCGGRPRCEPAETDLSGGEDDDTIVLGPLAEGTNVARVVAVSGTGFRSVVDEAATIRVDGTPPLIALSGAPSGWSNHPVEVVAHASDPLSGIEASGPLGPSTAIAVDGGGPTVVPGPRAAATVHGDGAHRVTASARDAVGNTGAADPAAAQTTVRIDETPPQLVFAASQDPERPERIVVDVADALSGPSGERGSIELRPAGSGLPFEPLPTTAAPGRLVAEWESDAFPRGEYEFRAVGFDLAGNRGTGTGRAGGAPMVLANPVKTVTALAFGFGGRRFVDHLCRRDQEGLHCRNRAIAGFGRRPASAGTGYGHSATVAGRLTGAAGAPLAGLPIEITESFDAGSETIRRTTTVASAADGFFLARLGPGPDRRVTVSFAGTPTLTAASGRELRLGVRGAVRLHVSSPTAKVGGAPVIFSGHLGRRGAVVPAAGLPVALEFRVVGLPWTEFRTVQTDARGAFRFPYAFSDDDSRGVRFQFRAHLAAQPGFPYDESYSRPVAVTGR